MKQSSIGWESQSWRQESILIIIITRRTVVSLLNPYSLGRQELVSLFTLNGCCVWDKIAKGLFCKRTLSCIFNLSKHSFVAETDCVSFTLFTLSSSLYCILNEWLVTLATTHVSFCSLINNDQSHIQMRETESA